MMFFRDEYTCIIQYISLAAIAALEDKLMNVVSNENIDYDAKPLLYLNVRRTPGTILIRYAKKWW